METGAHAALSVQMAPKKALGQPRARGRRKRGAGTDVRNIGDEVCNPAPGYAVLEQAGASRFHHAAGEISKCHS